MSEKNVVYFYDKQTKMVIHIWRHFDRVGQTNDIEQDDCTSEMVEDLKKRMKEGESWAFMLDLLTDNDINNLGCIHSPLLDTPMSYLCIDDSGVPLKLVPKPYLNLSVISADANHLKSDPWGPSSCKDCYTFETDGAKALEVKLQMCQFKDTECKRAKEDKKDPSFNKPVQVYVTHGRLDKKNGRYNLVNGECTIKWVLPDESICDAQIYVGDTHKDYVNSPHLCSNTINVECL
nr:hypothetical protein 2 [bacterium]